MECKNCQSTLNGQQKFCSECGEKITANRLTIKSILSLFLSQFLSYDNKFVKTVIDLTIKPDIVINNYINGFRKKYVNVIGYLGLSLTIIGLQFFVLRRFFPELLKADNAFGSQMPQENLNVIDFQSLMDSFYEYQGLLTVLFIPIYALVSWTLYLNSKKYNLAEHFVINIYTNAHFFLFWFIVVILTIPFGINYNLFSQFAIIPMIGYMTLVFYKLYDFSIWNTLLRVVLYYFIAFIIMMVIMVIVGVLYGVYLAATGKITPQTM
ncbi:hypothetical protein GCM10011531_27810 [Aquaticitalea lipolytica]|uniref:DUF3667 domain-containing protein n=1 Tax=Aquaticitalea lipolytica TaxID=1247562 RepID=A0A8J2XAT0_9FLAO|nr:DUF3667 domain-containing protein [Aquaticitalea lipolytica]GFZ94468.1 hypothetical protein GCM10011531_27810 [Aquaticitalea lipolytica]